MISVSASILAQERDISARRTLDALWIAAKIPQSKEECVATTLELAPFVELCGLSSARSDLHDTQVE